MQGKVMIIDGRKEWEASVSTAIELEEDLPFEIVSIVTNGNKIINEVKRVEPELIVVCSNMIQEYSHYNIDIPTIGYSCMTNKDTSFFKEKGILFRKEIIETDQLFDFIANYDPQKSSKEKKSVVTEAVQQTASEMPVFTVTKENNKSKQPNNDLPKLESIPKHSEAAEENVPLRKNLLYRGITNSKVDSSGDRLLRDLQETRFKTKVVTVYSAKGGVGKTTIATETASLLSMTSSNHAPGKYRVCIVDYNIDFGDVLTTLDYSQRGRTLIDWAVEIDEMIANGEEPDSINFTQEEIELYLQRKKDTGLYALLAPLVHEDSLNISGESLGVMLRNIIQNGKFDFVICDTGNNTRDSSFLALEAADIILMVATQDVSTVNDNDSFIRTMNKLSAFDESKIRLVINNILPTRETGVSPEDIIESVGYPCVAKITHTAEIIKANNNGSPLIHNTKHNYTKEIMKIAETVIGEPPVIEAPKGFFAKLFAKKKR